jgi:uncharacterized protein (DUF1697 family)
MAELRALLESNGLERVQTHLQSGNALFDAAAGRAADLASVVASEIARAFGCEVPVIVLEGERIPDVVWNNPFAARGCDPSMLHVTFLEREPDEKHVSWMQTFDPSPEALAMHGDAVYLCCPGGYAKTKLSNTFLERRFGVVATTRNWRTVSALEELVNAR